MNRNVPNYMQISYTSVKEDTLEMSLHRPPEWGRIIRAIQKYEVFVSEFSWSF